MSELLCSRCGNRGLVIEGSPYPGPLGRLIIQKVCQTCFGEWKKFSVNVINDFKLRPFLPKDRAVVEDHMKMFFHLEEGRNH